MVIATQKSLIENVGGTQNDAGALIWASAAEHSTHDHGCGSILGVRRYRMEKVQGKLRRTNGTVIVLGFQVGAKISGKKITGHL